MVIVYENAEGRRVEVELGDRPITIGRSPDADIVLADEKASRFHCGLRYWDGDYVLKDLKSRNGTFVNETRIEAAVLQAGDRIRVGGTVLTVDPGTTKGATTIIRELDQEMKAGKGYGTILREIVQDAGEEPSGESAG